MCVSTGRDSAGSNQPAATGLPAAEPASRSKSTMPARILAYFCNGSALILLEMSVRGMRVQNEQKSGHRAQTACGSQVQVHGKTELLYADVSFYIFRNLVLRTVKAAAGTADQGPAL